MTHYKIYTSKDGTKRLEFQDGYAAVIIPTKDEKNTICVSCQIGCPVGCKFCYTGKIGFKKNLDSEKIIEQVEISQKILGKKPTTIVFMGMGEPTLNLKNVLTSAEYFHKKIGLAYNKITISTSCLPNINSLLGVPYNVALSLHSPFDKIRKSIIAPGISVGKIMKFVKDYMKNQGKKKYIMIEYSMMKGINDREEDLKKLTSLKWPKNTLFNLIELNELGEFKRSDLETMQKFKAKIVEKGWKCFIRHSRGNDISAACGMLES